MPRLLLITLSFFITYAKTEPIDSVLADYCFDFKTDIPKVVLKNEIYKFSPIRLNTKDTINCVDYYSDTTAYFEFGENSNRNCCNCTDNYYKNDFYILSKLSGSAVSKINSFSNVIQPILTKSENISFDNAEHKKEELLLFKNKTIKAKLVMTIRCLPNFDTTLVLPFSANITSECK